MVRQFGAWNYAFAVTLGALTPSLASAEERAAAFTTYLREGPGVRFRVTDEVATGQAVNVDACADGWCRLIMDRASGFVPQAALIAPRTAPTMSPTTCFANRGNGLRGTVQEDFCYAASSPR